MESIKDLRLAIWQSKIAVKIELCQSSNIKDYTPLPFYTMMYTQHYPLFYFQSIYDHFKQWMNPALSSNHISLIYKDQKLQPNIPISVLVDLMQQNNIAQYVPITFQIKLDPESTLQTLHEEIYNQFYFNLKLSILAKFKDDKGSAVFQYWNQQRKDTFFNNITNISNDFENHLESIFKEYEDNAMDSKIAKVIYLPIRIFIDGFPGRIQLFLNITNECDTIGQCLRSILPKLYMDQERKTSILFNGVELDPNIPALYFYSYLYSIDGFCYFAIL